MLELKIDDNLVTCTNSFLTNQTVQLVINDYKNEKKEIETGIPQGFLLLPIVFLIYISAVFNGILETSLLFTFFIFINDIHFIVLGSFVKEIMGMLEKVAKKVIK